MTRDLVEPEGVDSTTQPPASPEPTSEKPDEGDSGPLPLDIERPPGPGQELAEGEG
jgi:hypothetical protein